MVNEGLINPLFTSFPEQNEVNLSLSGDTNVDHRKKSMDRSLLVIVTRSPAKLGCTRLSLVDE